VFGEGVDIRNDGGFVVGPGELVTFGEVIRNGERNKKLASLAGTLYSKEFPNGVVLGVLEYVNQNYTDTPIEREELENIVRSIARYHE
jgi:hypothetical protein